MIEIQTVDIEPQLTQIWVVKISFDGKYIATGGKSGILKIFEILTSHFECYNESYNDETIFEYLNFISPNPIRIYKDHTNDIIDISWCPQVTSYYLNNRKLNLQYY